jgi:uncharacterized protein YndB with AHSA1/START domain
MTWIGRAGSESELYMTRVFDAPRPLVFEAWSKPEHMPRWFAPAGCTMPDFRMDFRKGGFVSMTMQLPDGTRSEGEGIYDKIVPPELIAWTSKLHFQTPPLVVLTVVRFVDVEGKTLLCAYQRYLDDKNPEGAVEGWTSTLDNLEAIVKTFR